MQRIYLPGSEWLYLKIYGGDKTIDRFLMDDIPSIIRKLQKEALIEKWFFIRYSDPEFHLRIRFLINKKHNLSRIIELFNNKLRMYIQNSLIWKFQIDTYNRELERYGDNLIEKAESVFCYDSKCILSILKLLNNNNDNRWKIALKLIDCLLSDFAFDLFKKQKLFEQISKSFKIEFGFDEFNSKQFNSKFRDNKQIIESIMNNHIDDIGFTILLKPIKIRSQELKDIALQIKNEILVSESNISIETLIMSYIHMSINRLFASDNRKYELVLYDFLKRYYTSEIAKNNSHETC